MHNYINFVRIFSVDLSNTQPSSSGLEQDLESCGLSGTFGEWSVGVFTLGRELDLVREGSLQSVSLKISGFTLKNSKTRKTI